MLAAVVLAAVIAAAAAQSFSPVQEFHFQGLAHESLRPARLMTRRQALLLDRLVLHHHQRLHVRRVDHVRARQPGSHCAQVERHHLCRGWPARRALPPLTALQIENFFTNASYLSTVLDGTDGLVVASDGTVYLYSTSTDTFVAQAPVTLTGTAGQLYTTVAGANFATNGVPTSHVYAYNATSSTFGLHTSIKLGAPSFSNANFHYNGVEYIVFQEGAVNEIYAYNKSDGQFAFVQSLSVGASDAADTAPFFFNTAATFGSGVNELIVLADRGTGAPVIQWNSPTNQFVKLTHVPIANVHDVSVVTWNDDVLLSVVSDSGLTLLLWNGTDFTPFQSVDDPNIASASFFSLTTSLFLTVSGAQNATLYQLTAGPTSNPGHKSSGFTTLELALIAAGGAVVLIFAIIVIFACIRRHRRRQNHAYGETARSCTLPATSTAAAAGASATTTTTTTTTTEPLLAIDSCQKLKQSKGGCSGCGSNNYSCYSAHCVAVSLSPLGITMCVSTMSQSTCTKWKPSVASARGERHIQLAAGKPIEAGALEPDGNTSDRWRSSAPVAVPGKNCTSVQNTYDVSERRLMLLNSSGRYCSSIR